MNTPATLDLTLPFTIGMDLYPMENLGGCRTEQGSARRGQIVPLEACTLVDGERIRSVAGDGFEVWRLHVAHPQWGRLSFTTLDVTYVESYRHIAEAGPLPADVLRDRGNASYRAAIAHVDVQPGGAIEPAHLEGALGRARAGDALIVDAGQYTDRCLARGGGIIDFDAYNLQSPFFSEDAMKVMIDAEISLIAGNIPSYSNPEGGTSVTMLKLYWESPVNLIMAPLLRLGDIEAEVVTLDLNPWPVDYPACALPCRPVVKA